MGNEELADEIEALDAIYPGAIVSDGGFYKLRIPDRDLKAQISFPSSYPDEPPNVISASRMEDTLKSVLAQIFVPGQVCIFDLLEHMRELLEDDGQQDISEEEEVSEEAIAVGDPFEGWIESDPVTDRKSVFVARVHPVKSSGEAAAAITRLKQDKRIARATHNITAYRVNDTVVSQDCDDDGETAAGGRLLHLLQLTDCWNVVVCVTRWYGGIHLGPDRFKHINSSARDALVKGGFIDDSKKKKK